jgi:tRNA (mo5U34)-methyltransferase
MIVGSAAELGRDRQMAAYSPQTEPRYGNESPHDRLQCPSVVSLAAKLRNRLVRNRLPLIDPELRQEVERPPAWMYEWHLTDGGVTPVLGRELDDVHRTRLALLETTVRAALSAPGSQARVIDLACNEGWFSHRMLDWGASYVLGVDIRPQVIRRAELIRAHFGISADRLDLRCTDVFDLNPTELGTFDVVLCLGLVYHLENPVGALRVARALTGDVCVIESQLTKQDEPIILGNGQSDVYEESPASFASRLETDHECNPLASWGGVLSLTPNRAALLQMTQAAGFQRQEIAHPAPSHNQQYVVGDRAVLLAWPKERKDESASTTPHPAL